MIGVVCEAPFAKISGVLPTSIVVVLEKEILLFIDVFENQRKREHVVRIECMYE